MDISISTMFIPGIIVLMLCAAGLSSGITCDHSKQYPVQNNSSEILKCLDCRDCPAGSEPRVPCGKFISIHESIGGCRPCPDDTYSPNKDTKACQTCRRKKCFKHQVIEGECVLDKHDLSYCMDKCEKGYSMNNKKTACVLDVPLKNTTTTTTANTTSNAPKVTPTMNSIITTKKLVVSQDIYNQIKNQIKESNKESSRLDPGVIAVIVILTIGGIVAIAVVVWCYYRNLKRTDIGDKEVDEELASTVGLVDNSDAEKRDESEKFGTEEQTVEPIGFKSTANGPHRLESIVGFENSKPVASDIVSPNTSPQNLSVSGIANDINMARVPTPPMNNPVAFETPVQSPADELLGSRMGNARQQLPPPIIPTQCPHSSMHLPRNFNVDHTGPWRLDGNFPYKIYAMICECFDTGSVGRDWHALAGWLDLSIKEVKRIENKQFKTHEVIQTWTTEDGNDLQKFLQILNEKKMTQLAGDIIKGMQTMNTF